MQRDELLAWISNEPWLKQNDVDRSNRASRGLLNLLSHDEDSRCSKNEFLAAFDPFSTADVITLVVNLLRAGMVAKIPRLCYVYNSHDPYLNGRLRGHHSPEQSPEPGLHHPLSITDTPADTMLIPGQRGEAEKRQD